MRRGVHFGLRIGISDLRDNDLPATYAALEARRHNLPVPPSAQQSPATFGAVPFISAASEIVFWTDIGTDHVVDDAMTLDVAAPADVALIGQWGAGHRNRARRD